MAWGSLAIAGQKVAPGEVRSIRIQISESYTSVPVHMPITVIRGKRAGPTVSVTAAVHGDELIGIEVVRRVLAEMEDRELRGTLVCVPVVNVLGFHRQQRYLPDGRDLNRSFPGKVRGSPTSRMAHVFFTQVISVCNYGIDFHTGGSGRVNVPHIRSALETDAVRSIALAFGSRLVLRSKGEQGMLRNAAAKHGIYVLTYEAGEPLRFDSRIAQAAVSGTLNVLAALGMVERERQAPEAQLVKERSTWVRAERGGILIPNVVPGQLLRRGDEIARNTNPLGRQMNALHAPRNSLVVSMRTLPMVNPGDPVAQLVPIEDGEWEIAERAFPQLGTGPVVI
jgi:hypothetical protein